jgi:hypothetical protein
MGKNLSVQIIEEYIKFKNDSLLLISGPKKSSIYSINNKKEIYNLTGDSYFEFFDLNNDKLLLKV